METQFDKQVQWENGHRLCKVFEYTDKNQNMYLMGQFGNNNMVTIRKNTSQYAKEGEWDIQIIPIKFTKKEQNQPVQNQRPAPQARPQNAPQAKKPNIEMDTSFDPVDFEGDIFRGRP